MQARRRTAKPYCSGRQVLGTFVPKFHQITFPPQQRCALRSGNGPWPARGGCHERSSQRSNIVLLLDCVGYRNCDRGRDTDNLTVEARLHEIVAAPVVEIEEELEEEVSSEKMEQSSEQTSGDPSNADVEITTVDGEAGAESSLG